MQQVNKNILNKRDIQSYFYIQSVDPFSSKKQKTKKNPTYVHQDRQDNMSNNTTIEQRYLLVSILSSISTFVNDIVKIQTQMVHTLDERDPSTSDDSPNLTTNGYGSKTPQRRYRLWDEGKWKRLWDEGRGN